MISYGFFMIHTLTFQDSECDGDIGALAYIDGQAITGIIHDYEIKNNPADKMDGQTPKTSGDWAIPFHELKSEETISEIPLSNKKCAILLACGCGHSECSSTQIDMQITDMYVIWSNLRTWITKYEPYPNLGPWKFDRFQYEEACKLLHDRVQPRHNH